MQRSQLAQYYQNNFNSNLYLESYATERLEILPFFCKNLFNVFDQGKVTGPRCVDIGGGPIVHRLGYASRFCDQLVHTDFLVQNMDYVRKWLTTNELDQKHRHLMKFAASQEGYKNEEEGANLIEERLRSKLVSILPIDILDEEPIKNLDKHGGLFDCAISFACIECVCRTYEETVQAFKNIGRMLKPGAALVLEGSFNDTYYKVGCTTFPVLKWNPEWFEKALKEAGYRLELMELDTKPVFFGKDQVEIELFFSLCYKD